jgi:hypothetical protein
MKKTYQQPLIEESNVVIDEQLLESSLPKSEEEVSSGFLSREGDKIWSDDDE